MHVEVEVEAAEPASSRDHLHVVHAAAGTTADAA